MVTRFKTFSSSNWQVNNQKYTCKGVVCTVSQLLGSLTWSWKNFPLETREVLSLSSVGRALVLWAKGHGFEPRMENHFFASAFCFCKGIRKNWLGTRGSKAGNKEGKWCCDPVPGTYESTNLDYLLHVQLNFHFGYMFLYTCTTCNLILLSALRTVLNQWHCPCFTHGVWHVISYVVASTTTAWIVLPAVPLSPLRPSLFSVLTTVAWITVTPIEVSCFLQSSTTCA